MSFRNDNDAYEARLARRCDVVKKDVTLANGRHRKKSSK